MVLLGVNWSLLFQENVASKAFHEKYATNIAKSCGCREDQCVGNLFDSHTLWTRRDAIFCKIPNSVPETSVHLKGRLKHVSYAFPVITRVLGHEEHTESNTWVGLDPHEWVRVETCVCILSSAKYQVYLRMWVVSLEAIFGLKFRKMPISHKIILYFF